MDMSIRFPKLGIEFEYVARAFRISGFEFSVYGLLIAAGMLIGLAVVMLEVKRAKEDQNQYLLMLILALAGALIGARLFYAAFSWKQFQGDFMEVFRIRNGGMAIYGAIFGGILAIALYARLRKLDFMKMADFACIGLLAGQIIGRWGDFFNRESFGEYTDCIFAMQIPLASVRSSEVTSVMRENLVMIDGVSYIQVHPAFFYESMWCLILLFILLGYKRRKKFQGEIFMRYLAGYGFGRFWIEYLRTDGLMIPGIKISVSLVVSAGLFIVFGTVATVERFMMKKREALRRRRSEAYYEAEERAAAEQEAAGRIAKEKTDVAEGLQEPVETEMPLSEDQDPAKKTECGDSDEEGPSEKTSGKSEAGPLDRELSDESETDKES